MSRDVRVVLLCEDDQHEQFARAFLREYLRWSKREERRFVEVKNVSRSVLGPAEKAVIFADFWILPKMGLRSGYAGWKRIAFDWPAALAWIGTLGAVLWFATSSFWMDRAGSS